MGLFRCRLPLLGLLVIFHEDIFCLGKANHAGMERARRSKDENSAAPLQSSMQDIIDRIAKVEFRLSQLESFSAASRNEMMELRKNNTVLMDAISKLVDGSKGGQVTGSGNPCPKDWFSFSRLCYKYHSDPESWNSAEAKCQAYGAKVHLATIPNHEEMSVVAKQLTELFHPKHQVWIGMYRLKGGKFPRWRWADFSAADYMPWAAGEPGYKENEHCVALSAKNLALWGDHLCTEKLPFLCRFTLH